MIYNPEIFHIFAVEGLTKAVGTLFDNSNNTLKMAKIGYIMATAHYDNLEEDRQWMQEYGCVKIVEENDADEKSRPLWKQLMIALERGDELVISKFSNAIRGARELARKSVWTGKRLLSTCMQPGIRLMTSGKQAVSIAEARYSAY